MKKRSNTGRPAEIKFILIAKKWYKPPYTSLQDVADKMTKRFGRKVYKTTVARWVNYRVHKIR